MAKNDKDNGGSYEPDAFDNPPKGPSGVHRGNRSLAARLTPFVVVVLVAALAGFVAWGFFSGEVNQISWPWSSSSSSAQGSSDSSSSSSAKKKAAAKKKAQEEAAKKKAEEQSTTDQSDQSDQQSTTGQSDQQSTTDQQTDGQSQQTDADQQAQQAAQPNKATSVRVVNGTRTSGYAASKKSTLDAAGYTNVVAANPTGNLPSATVVWYQSETDKATAEDVAAKLGISNVQQASGIAAPVVVVLLN